MRIPILCAAAALTMAASYLAPPPATAQKASQQIQALIGVVLDSATGEALQGASVRVPSISKGMWTQKGGKFRIPVANNERYSVIVSYIGYHETRLTIRPGDTATIRLKPASLQTGNVVVTDDIPAEEIIKRAIARRDENEARVKTVEGLLYSKIVLDIGGNLFGQMDEKNRGSITETYSRVYEDREKKRNISTIVQRRQTANLKADDNVMALGNFFSFYNDEFRLLNTTLRSPLGKYGLDDYRYTLLGRRGYNNKFIYNLAVEPKNRLYPGMEGRVSILEGTWELVECDLRPTRETAITWVDSLRFEQKFSPVQDSVWMPTYLRVTANIRLALVVGVAEITPKFSAVSVWPELKINGPIPDSVFASLQDTSLRRSTFRQGDGMERSIVVAQNADSSKAEFWEQNSVAILNDDEEALYKRADSLVRLDSVRQEGGAPSATLLDYNFGGNFNRVTALAPLATLSSTLGPVTQKLTAIYSIGLEKPFGSAEWTVRTGLPGKITLSGSVFSSVAGWPNNQWDEGMNTVAAGLFHHDHMDYLRKDGWNAGVSGSVSELQLFAEAEQARHFALSNTTARSTFIDRPFRNNPQARAGEFTTISAGLNWNNYGNVLTISTDQSLTLRAKAVLQYGEGPGGSAFRTADLGVRLSTPTFSTGYLPMALRLSGEAFLSSGDIAPQYATVIPSAFILMPKATHFLSAPIGIWGGATRFMLAAEHDFSDFFWRLVGLPKYEGRGLDLLVGVKWSRTEDAVLPYRTTGFAGYSEATVSLARIPTFFSNVFFLRADLGIGIGPLAAGRTGFGISLSGPF